MEAPKKSLTSATSPSGSSRSAKHPPETAEVKVAAPFPPLTYGRLATGVAMILTMYISTFFGVLIMVVPCIPLIFIDQRWYRAATDMTARMWLRFPPALIELVAGTKYHFYGDEVPYGESVISIPNHRNRLDWLLAWSWVARIGDIGHEKIALKADLRQVPGPGWACQLFGFLFLERRWEKDQDQIAQLLSYYSQSDYPLHFFIFPEGTCMDPVTLARSNRHADTMGLSRYEYVLHPRTTGFVHGLHYLRDNIDAIYDVTLGYWPFIPCTEKDIGMGYYPEEVHIHVKRYPIEKVPESPTEQAEWLKRIWADKEERLRKFYQTGNFLDEKEVTLPVKEDAFMRTQWLSIAYWIGLTVVGMYLAWWFPYFRYYLYLASVFLELMSFFCPWDLMEPKMWFDSNMQAKKIFERRKNSYHKAHDGNYRGTPDFSISPRSSQ
eukprot:Clim_evm25s236 gene=Clim_evmTU25s236